jgi:hypothetical protein
MRADERAASAAAIARMEQRRDEARGMKQSRAVEVQARLDEEKRAAQATLEVQLRESSARALVLRARQQAEMAVRVQALAVESKGWLPPDTEMIDERIGPELFATVRCPVNDTPAFSRRPARSADSGSGVAPDAELLNELAREGAVDLPIWLRHTLVGPSGASGERA